MTLFVGLAIIGGIAVMGLVAAVLAVLLSGCDVRYELHLTEPLSPGRHLLEWGNTADTQSGRVAYLKPVREKP